MFGERGYSGGTIKGNRYGRQVYAGLSARADAQSWWEEDDRLLGRGRPSGGQAQGCRGQQAPVLASQALRIGEVDVGPGPWWRLPSPPREGSGIVDATGCRAPWYRGRGHCPGRRLTAAECPGQRLWAASVRGGRHWVVVIPSLPARLEAAA